MKIKPEIKGYIEHELYHYTAYKEELVRERERILDANAGHGFPDVFNPRGTLPCDATQNKAVELCQMPSTTVLSLTRTVNAVENTLSRLSKTHKDFFDLYYVKREKDMYFICDKLHVAERTYKRIKWDIIYGVGVELGAIKMLS